MSWKYVLNGDNGNFEGCIEVAEMAGKSGYSFFVYKGRVYFRDKISMHYYDTGISVEDLF